MGFGYGHNIDKIVPIHGGGIIPVSYLLDTYTDPSIGYSLKKLNTLTTNVIRVKRSVGTPSERDFTADEITNGTLVSWVGVGNDGDVAVIYDQGTIGNDATQVISASQGRIVSAGVLVTVNGEPAIALTEGVSYMDITNTIPYTHPDGMSIFVVHDTAGSGVGRYISQNDGSGLDYGVNGWMLANDQFRINLFASRPHTSTVGLGQILVSAHQDSTDKTVYHNGSLDASWVESAATFTPIGVAYLWRNGFNWTGSGLGGYFQETIVFKLDQVANRAAIETEINSRYSIY